MKTNSTPTLNDVARRAGVSTATVSRALNEPHRLTDSTRELVLRVVDELGYTPHFGGRGLVSNRSNTIGAIIPTMDNDVLAVGAIGEAKPPRSERLERMPETDQVAFSTSHRWTRFIDADPCAPTAIPTNRDLRTAQRL